MIVFLSKFLENVWYYQQTIKVLLRISFSSGYDFKSQILVVVVAISFSFYSFDCVGNAFEFPGMDFRFALIHDAVPGWTSVFSFNFNSYLLQQ